MDSMTCSTEEKKKEEEEERKMRYFQMIRNYTNV